MHIKKMILVFLLWFAGLGAAAQFAKVAVPFAEIQALYPQYDTELGWLLSLISLVGAILGIVGGTLVNALGPKRVLLAGLVLGGAISLWQATLPGFGIILFSRIPEGLSHLAIVVAAPTLIVELTAERFRGAAMALWGTFFGVAFVLIAALSGPLLAQGGLTYLFMAHGGTMLIIALLLGIGLAGEYQRHGNTAPLKLSFVFARHIQAYQSPYIAAPGIGWFFYTLTFVSILTILPQLVPAEDSAFLAGSMPLISIAASMILVPLMLVLMSGIRVVVVGFATSILVVLWALTGADLVVVGIALFAMLGLVQGATFAAIPELAKSVEHRALSYGVMAQTGNIGNLIGTPALLAVLTFGGQPAMFISSAVVYGLAIGAHLLLHRRRNIEEQA